MTLPRLLQSPPPEVAVEIDTTHVAAARLEWRAGMPAVAAHALEPLPPGMVVPALGASNVLDIPHVGRALRQAVGRVAGRVSRVALVLPDTVAKVSLLRFEKVPPQSSDLDALVRWQVRKSAPFPVEQAVVSYTPGVQLAEGGQEFIVSVSRADIIGEYEQACTAAGLHAGLVDVATFSIINGVLAGSSAPAADWLLVHVTTSYTTLTVLRGSDLIFFRNRGDDTEGTLADVVHQTAMYYEDRLSGAGFSRVLLAGGAVQAVDAVRRSLEQRLDVRIEPVTHPELAALAGILARERKAA